MRSASVTPWRSNAGGLVGNGCVGEVFSPGTFDCGTGRSSIGHTGLPLVRSSTNRNPFLFGCITALILRPSTVMSPSIAGPTLSYSQRS